MENPIVTTLVLTLVGMAVVFVTMSLFYGSMRLLTSITGKRPTEQAGPTMEPDIGRSPDTSKRLRAAAVAVALARAEMDEAQHGAGQPSTPGRETPWGDYYRQRQLRPGDRGRIA